MIYQLNTGNILPFFESKENQIGRREELNCSWGIPVPRMGFLPFQFMSGVPIQTFSLSYVNMCDEETIVPINSSYLVKHCTTETGPQFLTYDGAVISEEDFGCGLYYLILTINGISYYSEVMELKVICDFESLAPTITNCQLEPVIGGDGVRFDFTHDSVSPSVNKTYTYEYNIGAGWVQGTSFALLKSLETAEIRITMVTSCGTTTVMYELEWDDADPCGTYFLTDITND